jgi:hypothetical protein
MPSDHNPGNRSHDVPVFTAAIDFNPCNGNSSMADKVIAEERRLKEARAAGVPWGPYLAERQCFGLREIRIQNQGTPDAPRYRNV